LNYDKYKKNLKNLFLIFSMMVQNVVDEPAKIAELVEEVVSCAHLIFMLQLKLFYSMRQKQAAHFCVTRALQFHALSLKKT
jgi:hypothetical protein